MVQQHILNITRHPTKKLCFHHEVLGKTPSNHNIDVLTVTNKVSSSKDERKIILIMARQHPGETISSHVM